MPQPNPGDLHIDTLLTQVSIAYQNAEYIADQIAPIVPVNKQSDIIPKYDQSHWFRDEARVRPPGAMGARGGWTVDNTNKYFCDRWSYGHEVPDDVRDNADAVYNLDRDSTEFVTDKLQMRREVAFSTNLFTTGVWGTDKVGNTDFTQWSNYAASSPITDIATYVDIIEGLIGRTPNTWVMGKQVWTQLRWHPDLIDLIKYTQKAVISSDLFASLIEFAKVLVGRAIYTTTAEGTAESAVTYSRIWGKNAGMFWVPDRPSLLAPAAAYTFVWQRVPNAIQYVKRMRNEEREIDIIEGNSYFTQVKTGANAGLFMSGAVA